MIEKIHIENYKSISSLDLELGRVTVLIGENGSGKSNILEAIALASAASQNKLDNEFLGNRGIRVSHPYFMRSAFEDENHKKNIEIHLKKKNEIPIEYKLTNNNQTYSTWTLVQETEVNSEYSKTNEEIKKLQKELQTWETMVENFRLAINFVDNRPEDFKDYINRPKYQEMRENFDAAKSKLMQAKSLLNKTQKISKKNQSNALFVNKFMIYSPENSSLRLFEKEAQVEPLGVKGEGLYKLLKFTSSYEPEKINIIKEYLSLISWFSDFEIPNDKFGSQEILLTDKYIQQLEREAYNHKSTNEGFLFILFYVLLFVSNETPYFFAIDNIDASLNPKLCTELARRIVQLAKDYDKQVILTTHNPAILDGIDLNDEEQKILVVSRNMKGHTRLREVKPPKARRNKPPMKLSEAFLKGMIGGLPDTFSLFSPIKEEEIEEGEEKEDLC